MVGKFLGRPGPDSREPIELLDDTCNGFNWGKVVGRCHGMAKVVHSLVWSERVTCQAGRGHRSRR